MIEPTAHHLHLYQYTSTEQRRGAGYLGMWAALAGEIVLFAALVTAVTAYRIAYPAAFAEATHAFNLSFGLAGVLVLVLAGLFMGLAAQAARTGGGGLAAFLALTVLLGIAFIVIKGFEFGALASLAPPSAGSGNAPPPEVGLLYALIVATGVVFIIQVLIGVMVALAQFFLAREQHFTPHNSLPVDLAALFWQVLVLAAVVLFPLLYLIGRA